MKSQISYFYFYINKMNNMLSLNKDVISKLLVGRVKAALRNYDEDEWKELRSYFDDFSNYCCYHEDVDYNKLLILFVILSSYKENILNLDVDVLNSLIETFIHNEINPFNYERYVALCFYDDVISILTELRHDELYPLTFLLEAMTEYYSIEDLELKDGILFKTILKKITNRYEGPFFKNNFSFFNIMNTLKKKMDEINKEKKVFDEEDYQALYNLEKLFLENDDKERLINKLKEIEDELLTDDTDKIRRMLDIIKMANHNLIKVFELKKSKS